VPHSGLSGQPAREDHRVVAGTKGFDAGKTIQGRTRHLLVDTLGLRLAVVVTSAAVQDRDGAKRVLRSLTGSGKTLRRVWVDGGYRGQLRQWVTQRFRFVLDVVLRADHPKVSSCCRAAGWWSALSPGSIATAA
jgi:hypothetical protein